MMRKCLFHAHLWTTVFAIIIQNVFQLALCLPIVPVLRYSGPCLNGIQLRVSRDDPVVGTHEGDLMISDDESTVYLPIIRNIQDFKLDASEAGRVFHGRGGLFPGCEHITLDWFPPVWLLTSHNQELQAEDLGIVQRAIEARRECEADVTQLNFVYQFRSLTNATTTSVVGEIPLRHVITEKGMKFLVRLDRARNHGIFLDMANGRDWIRQRAQGKTILNLFAYTCGFSVAALCGGATSVVNMDMVDGVLKTGQRNHELNGLRGARFLAHDIFKSWGKLRKLGPFDIIVADPPSFQKKSFVAQKDYGKVIRRLPDMLETGGVVMLCLNAPELDSKWLQDLVAEEAPNLVFVEWLDNPTTFACAEPERGLKVFIYRLCDDSSCDSVVRS